MREEQSYSRLLAAWYAVRMCNNKDFYIHLVSVQHVYIIIQCVVYVRTVVNVVLFM